MKIGDIVYLKTDRNQSPRMIIEILIQPTQVMYRLACGTLFSWHYEMEITEVRDVLLAMDAGVNYREN